MRVEIFVQSSLPEAYQLSLFPLIGSEDLEDDKDVDDYEGNAADYVRELSKRDIKSEIKPVRNEPQSDVRLSGPRISIM